MGCGRQILCLIIWLAFMFSGHFTLALLFAIGVVLAITKEDEND